MKVPSTPWFLRPHRWVAHVETLALACAGAAGATAVFGALMKDSVALVAGVPTLVTAGCWVGLVRLDPRFGEDCGRRARWLLALPLALVNGALGGGLFCWLTGGFGHLPSTFLGGAALGATFGIVYWGPALLATLLVLGAPLRFAERRARRGLSGEDLGGKMVGAAAATQSLIALVWQLVAQKSSGHRMSWGEAQEIRRWLRPLDADVGASIALLGIVAGAIVLIFSAVRSAKRKALQTRVELGLEPGFRVNLTQRGTVLVKLRAPREPFRTTNLPEEVFPLEVSSPRP